MGRVRSPRSRRDLMNALRDRGRAVDETTRTPLNATSIVPTRSATTGFLQSTSGRPRPHRTRRPLRGRSRDLRPHQQSGNPTGPSRFRSDAALRVSTASCGIASRSARGQCRWVRCVGIDTQQLSTGRLRRRLRSGANVGGLSVLARRRSNDRRSGHRQAFEATGPTR